MSSSDVSLPDRTPEAGFDALARVEGGWPLAARLWGEGRSEAFRAGEGPQKMFEAKLHYTLGVHTSNKVKIEDRGKNHDNSMKRTSANGI